MPLKLRLFLAIAAYFFVFFEASPARAATSQIEVTVINCAQDILVSPKLRLTRGAVAGESLNDVPVEGRLANPTAQRGVFALSLAENPGNYGIGASTPHCQTREPTQVAVYATGSRHILLAPSASCCTIPILYSGSIAVSVPEGVWVGLYRISRGRSVQSRFGTLDARITYFANAEPGPYEVALSVSGVTACIPITVPQILQATQRYISLDTSALAALFRSKTQCIDTKANQWYSQ